MKEKEYKGEEYTTSPDDTGNESLYNEEKDSPLYEDDDDSACYDEDDEEADNGSPRHRRGAWRSWLRVWATPLAGWKAMRQQRLSPAAMESSVFYPLAALAALGAFARKFYFPNVSVSSCLIEATCVFVAFFATYFLTFPIARLLMRQDCAKKVDSPFGHCYVAGLLATLEFFFFLYECLPFLEVILAATPAYTIYLSYKGIPALRIPSQRRISTWVALILLILSLPFLVYELLGIMLPPQT